MLPPASKSPYAATSARIKPFSKSVWITPAAWGAVAPTGGNGLNAPQGAGNTLDTKDLLGQRNALDLAQGRDIVEAAQQIGRRNQHLPLAPTERFRHMGRKEGLLRCPEDPRPGGGVPRPVCGIKQRALLQDHQLDPLVIVPVAVYGRQRIGKGDAKALDAAKSIERRAQVTLHGKGLGQVMCQDAPFGARQ